MRHDTFVRALYRFQQRIGMTAPEFRAVCIFAGLLLTGSVVQHVRVRLDTVDPAVYADTDGIFRESAAAAGLGPFAAPGRSPRSPAGVHVASAADMGSDSTAQEAPATLRSGAADPPAGKIDINTADSDELQSLPGIGPALAHRILDFRERNGAFLYVEDLLMIRGIGERTLERLAPYVTVDGTELPDEVTGTHPDQR